MIIIDRRSAEEREKETLMANRVHGAGAAPPPRIAPVTEPDEDQLARLAKAPRTRYGAPLGLFATLAHRPRLMTRLNALGGALMFDSSIAARERELVILRTAGRSGCVYEIAHHRALGERAGLTRAEVDAAVDAAMVHEWTDADRAVLRVVDEVTFSADVSDAGWAGLDGVLEPPQRLELLALVGFYRMLAGILNGARVVVDPESFAPGEARNEPSR
jgi:4-carboxymuconolactone decarboxylase